MKILQIANKAIYPPDGGNIAILNLSKGYIKNGADVHLLNMVTHKHINKLTYIESDSLKDITIKGIHVNSKISILKLIFNLLFSNQAYIAKRFISKSFQNELNKLLSKQKFDIVQIEGLYCLQYVYDIKKIFKGKIIYRPHNIEYQIWKQNAIESKHILKRIYYTVLSKRLKYLELKLLNQYDFILPISENDNKTYTSLGNIKPSLITPFGIDIKVFKNGNQKAELENQSINYIGALDWIPNQQGILWFIKECLPLLISKFQDITFNIAGRNAPKWFIQKLVHPNINFLGEIENASELYQTPGPLIVPLFSGSGMRVKIIEGMAFKKAIVSTEIGAEGIDFLNGENILIANTAEEFSKSIIQLISDTSFQKDIGDNAYKFVKEKYDFINIASNVLKFIQQ